MILNITNEKLNINEWNEYEFTIVKQEDIVNSSYQKGMFVSGRDVICFTYYNTAESLYQYTYIARNFCL